MPLPIPNLDDRRFDDLVADARVRMASHLPELTQIAPGDPAHALIDLFAYFTETILYRANLIPERQRRVVLNLLQIPLRNARPSKGLVCIDSSAKSENLPPLLRDGVQLKAGSQSFTGLGELQATPLGLSVSIKQKISDAELAAMGLTPQDLLEQYGLKRGERPQPFQPRNFVLGSELLSLEQSLDQLFYLALTLPKTLQGKLAQVREAIAGISLNIAIAPADDLDGDEINSLSPRNLLWELLTQTDDGKLLPLPLEVVSDSSRGGRQMGVVRLRLPRNPQLFDSLAVADPMFAGLGDLPPELPAPLSSERVAAWLRLSCADDPNLVLGYLGVNGLEVIGQGLKQDIVLGVGSGNPDQIIALPDSLIAAESLQLDVEEEGAWVPWAPVDFLVDLDSSARVYKLDPVAGQIYFGDGLEAGKRPPAGMRIRAARYRHGGGAAGNLAAGEIKELSGGSSRLSVRHEWPCKGGVDAETVAQAERRIPQFLTHRNRAVTKQDFQILAQNNPVNPVARALVLEGFLPGANINAARDNVPGVVSVFVLPPRYPALRQTPRPSKGLLKDVFEYLLQRLLIGTELYVLSPEFIPVAVGVTVDVLDPDTEQQTLQAVQAALVEYLWPLAPGGAHGEGWPMGGSVNANELQTQVARVAGVRAVKALSLFQKTESGWQRLKREQLFTLKKYQLPELMGVSVSTANGEPALPGGIEPVAGGRGVPAPVIPEVC
ncbi:MAG TPA: putative baseplate assembly protein [Cellvibrio sp.]|nr:putative baseplate assembly protein [Cellvibrio sp.]